MTYALKSFVDVDLRFEVLVFEKFCRKYGCFELVLSILSLRVKVS